VVSSSSEEATEEVEEGLEAVEGPDHRPRDGLQEDLQEVSDELRHGAAPSKDRRVSHR
jgi:hypothetical protein